MDDSWLDGHQQPYITMAMLLDIFLPLIFILVFKLLNNTSCVNSQPILNPHCLNNTVKNFKNIKNIEVKDHSAIIISECYI